jgi:3-isopropylmalate dehydratase small subunit
MTPFTRLTSPAIPLPAADVDTDIIFPARFLLITAKRGLGRYAFYEWRYQTDGAERPDFVLNRVPWRGAEILIGGDNFGCGSSREQAVWALHDLGVRVLVSTRFGEIFQANCFKNGMLPITVTPAERDALMAEAQAGGAFSVDLEAQTLTRPDGATLAFSVDPFRREALLNGWDEIAIVLNQSEPDITAWETRRRAGLPWLY